MDLLEFILDIVAFIAGISLILWTLKSAIRTFVLPRGENAWLTRTVFWIMQTLFRRGRFNALTYRERDRRMALFAPTTLLILPLVWMFLILVGFSGIYFALGINPYYDAFVISGSSLMTLGTIPFVPNNIVITMFQFVESAIGMGVMALLISYLPTMYGAFSQREAVVSMLEVRAGKPPAMPIFITRLHNIKGLDNMGDTWTTYEQWFTYLEETHTSLAPLVFFRSPDPERSWVTTAGVILDTAAFVASSVDIERQPQAELCIRAGFLALRSIAGFFQIEYNPSPLADDPISIDKMEFMEVYEALYEAGVPLKPDAEQCWKDFAGWRVNYDDTLLQLAMFTMAPYAPWSSDRSRPTRIRPRDNLFTRLRS